MLWIVGWALAALLAARTRHEGSGAVAFVRGAAWLLLVGAAGAGALSVWGQRALDTSDLSVVLRPETMYIAPGTDAEAMGGVTTGDVVQRVERQGAWERVVHADGREGWLPSLRLVALSADGAPGSLPSVGPSFEPALTPLR